MPKEVITFGCRLNTFESEIIKDVLNESGAKNTIVFNTCAVTSEAVRQTGQAIRKYHRENPDIKIIVTGCGAQLDPEKYANIPGVERVLGNKEKLSAKSYIPENTEKILVSDVTSLRETASHLIGGFEGRSRAYLQVQNGCDYRCTFCIVPFARGSSRSIPINAIIEQTKLLVANGYKEIVVTGVDICSYGLDLEGNISLGKMLKQVLIEVPDLPRLRLSSIDVAGIDEDLRDIIIAESRLMPHLHLSLQSGDNMILKRMKRRHNRQDIIALCTDIRELREEVVFGADIITGFPTETDEMFSNTKDIIEETNITYLHVFPYSKRDGTPAASISSVKQIPISIRKKRAAQLRKIGKKQLKNFLHSRIGKVETIIMESSNIGRTEHFALIKTDESYPEGEIISGKVIKTDGKMLYTTRTF